ALRDGVPLHHPRHRARPPLLRPPDRPAAWADHRGGRGRYRDPQLARGLHAPADRSGMTTMSEPAIKPYAASGVDRTSFLNAMSRVAMTVNIVTTDGVAGRDGLVVSAMAPVSVDMERPTLLICVN